MAEWLCEAGIGEARAALVDHGAIVEAAIEWDDGALRVGDVVPARLGATLSPGRRAIVTLDGGGEAVIAPIPPGVTEGAALTVEIVRESMLEPGRIKRPLCRASDRAPGRAPDLSARLEGAPVRLLASHATDDLEAAGWSELIEEAAIGEIAFPGGALRLSLTPAMTLFDVDGTLPPAALAVAGARAAAGAIRRMGIGGSIGIDLPTLASRTERLAAAAAIDEALPQPFERTAVNGFGFIQIVRRRERLSLPERLRSDPVGAAARALLRRAERSHGAGRRTLVAVPAVVAALAARDDWLAELARRTGAAVGLRADPALAISAGHVEAEHP